MGFFRRTRSGGQPDYFLLALIFILTVLGLVILSSASVELGKIKFNNSYYYLQHQILFGLVPGLIGFFIGYLVNFHAYRKLSFWFLLANLFLLVLVFTPLGSRAGGASRWLELGPITFQPAEFLKLSLILYLAAWLTNPKANRIHSFLEGSLPFLIVCGIIAGLLLLQPATSTVVILLASGVAIFFLSGAKWKHLFATALLGLAALALVIYITPYRRERITTFFNHEADAHGAGYQINQALIAIGSGGLTGIGFGESTNKLGTLPAPIEDSIFAIAAQELGFVGAGILVILFALLVFRLVWIANRVGDRFGYLILMGFATIIALQSIVNMGAISGLLPLTGVPLPFVSYGGTALAVFLTMSGIAVNISKRA